MHTWELRLQLDGDLAHSEIRAERDVVEHLGALVGVDAHLRERLGRRLLGGRLGEDVHDGSTTASCSCVSSLRLRTELPFLTSMMTASNITAAQSLALRHSLRSSTLVDAGRLSVPLASPCCHSSATIVCSAIAVKSLCSRPASRQSFCRSAGPEKQPGKHRRLIFSWSYLRSVGDGTGNFCEWAGDCRGTGGGRPSEGLRLDPSARMDGLRDYGEFTS